MDIMVSLSETSYDSDIPGLGKEKQVHFQDFYNRLVTVFFLLLFSFFLTIASIYKTT